MSYKVIYLTVHGSRAYGLARPGSDTDLKGVCVGDPSWYLGFRGGPEQVELSADHVFYELRKFMRLAAAANPTLLETLYTEPSAHRILTAAGRRLLAARDAFLSRRAGRSFGGYALAQLRRIKNHRRWLLDPPRQAPRREDFGLRAQPELSREELGAALSLEERAQLQTERHGPGFLTMLRSEKRFAKALRNWQDFRRWQRERNPDRHALEARFGYDTKHAQHLVRLLRMGLEVLQEGAVRVLRPDREELLAIRDGRWSYDELIGQAEELGARIRAAEKTSPLPAQPDLAALDALCVELVEEVWGVRGPSARGGVS